MDAIGIEWDSLRRAHEELSRKISQIVWLRLLLLLLVVLVPYGGVFLFEIMLGTGSYGQVEDEWLMATPMVIFLLTLSELYLHILRKKRQLIEQVAADRIVRAAESCFTLDHLLFARGERRAAPFAHHPGQLTKWLHATAIVALLVPFTWMLVSFAEMQPDAWVPMGIVGLAGLYATVYGRYVSVKLERQAAATIGHELPPTWVARLWEKGQESARRQVAQLRPRFSVVTGSLLILMTLYLGMTVGSCGAPRAGYTIITGEEKWVSTVAADLMGKAEEGVVPRVLGIVGRCVYSLSLLMAALSVVLVLSSTRRAKIVRGTRFLTILAAVSGGISLFVLADYLFYELLPIAAIGLPWVLGWLVPLGLWYAYGFRQNEAGQMRWSRIRALLVLLYLPIVVVNLFQMTFAVWFKVYGLLPYYFGVHLVALGYLKLAAQARAAAVGEQDVVVPLQEMGVKRAAM